LLNNTLYFGLFFSFQTLSYTPEHLEYMGMGSDTHLHETVLQHSVIPLRLLKIHCCMLAILAVWRSESRTF